MYYRDLELKAKSILTVGEILEIEQGSIYQQKTTSDYEDVLGK